MKRCFVLFEKYFEPVCIVTLITLMTAIICIQIILRIFGASVPEAEEIARFFFVWAMYLSISYAIRDDRHIRITLFVERMPPSLRTFVYNCVDLIFIIYSGAIVLFGYRVILRSLELGQIAPATEVPVAILYGSVVIGSLLNICRLIIRLYQRLKSMDSHTNPKR